MSSPRISVTMPVRNAAPTLPAAVDSLLAQTDADFELIAVDHDSRDDTPWILTDYARRDPRVLVHRWDGAFVEAANLAWRESRGELIARMDADDIAHPRRLEIQRDFLDSHPDLAGCAGLVRIRKRLPDGSSAAPDGGYARYEQWVNSVRSPVEIAAQRFVDSPLPNPTTMVRRDALEAVGGYRDPEWAEDYDLWLRMIEDGFRFGKVGQIVLDWYDAPERSTRTLPRYEWALFQKAKASYLSRLPLVRELGVVLSGAGPTGKEFAGLLAAEGTVRVHAFLEVNRRQVGNTIGGIPVHAAGEIDRWPGHCVLLGAAGRPDARDRIRAFAREAGFVEGEDFFSIA